MLEEYSLNFCKINDDEVWQGISVPECFWKQLLELVLNSNYKKYEIKFWVDRCSRLFSNSIIMDNIDSVIAENVKNLIRKLSQMVAGGRKDLLLESLGELAELGKQSVVRVNNLLSRNGMNFYFEESTKAWRMKGEKMMEKDQISNKIFISYSSKDKEYVLALIEFLEDIGLEKENIFCTVIPEYGIPLGCDIYDYIKEQFLRYEIWVIYILSENYYCSPACLNEMGAAWIMQKEYTSILLPDFKYQEIKGAINAGKIGIQLQEENLEFRLRELNKQLQDKFGLLEIEERRWQRYIKNFRDKIMDIA